MILFYILWVIACPILTLVIPTRIIGRKYYRQIKKKASIFVCNHQSNFDSVILKCRVNTRFKVMAKDSLFKTPGKRWFFTHIVDAYPVKRGENDVTAIKTTLKYLKDDKSLLIFPEGTRNKDGNLSEFKTGVVMFALKTDCYVIPSAFQKMPRLFRSTRLLIGKPFKFSDYDEFKGCKIEKDILDKATEILFNKVKYLKEVNIKEYKNQIKKDLKKKKD